MSDTDINDIILNNPILKAVLAADTQVAQYAIRICTSQIDLVKAPVPPDGDLSSVIQTEASDRDSPSALLREVAEALISKPTAETAGTGDVPEELDSLLERLADRRAKSEAARERYIKARARLGELAAVPSLSAKPA